MCGRFAMDDSVNALISEFVETTGRPPEQWQLDWKASYNVRPSAQVPVLLETLADRDDPQGEVVRRAELAQWWLTPPFSKELRGRYPTFNARSETLTEKASFRGPVKRQRGVIPATGYYEYRSEGEHKVPYFIRPPEGVLLFAGLYSWWADPAKAKDDDTRWHLTATIVTRAAVGDVASIHDRTPLTLPSDAFDEWIDPRVEGDAAFVEAMVHAATPVAESLEFSRVAGPIRGDSPELIRPLDGGVDGGR